MTTPHSAIKKDESLPINVMHLAGTAPLLNNTRSAVSLAALAEGINTYRKIISASDLYHLPDRNDIGDAGIFIKATIREAAYYKGRCYIGISTHDRHALSYAQCANEEVIIENDAGDYCQDSKINPQQEPGKLLKMISMHIGQTMMLGIYKNGRVGNIAYQNGWCWDDQ